MADTVLDKMVVGLTYVLRDGEGNLIEERKSDDPLLYIQGLNQIMPKIEETVEGKTVGFKAELVVQPDEYYGEYDDNLIAQIERSEFPEDFELEVGAQFEVEGPNGDPLVAQVIEMDDNVVTVDGNHPLAGVELHFQLVVDSVRPATSEEISHGHVHGQGGHVH